MAFDRDASLYPLVSLSDLMDIQGGAQPPASTFRDEPEPGYIRFVQIRDFETDAHLTYIKDEAKWRHCSKEDVLIARYGASVGRICRGVVGAYNVALVKVVPKAADREFLYHLLRSPFFQEPIASMSGRSAQAGFNKGDLAVIQVPFPSLEEQRCIAAVLSPLDIRIRSLREVNATLEAIAHALFKSWFVDFDPVHAKAEGREPQGMNAATAADFPCEFEDSELGPIPKGWRVQSLVDAFEINPKRTLKKGALSKYLDMASVPTTGHVPAAPVDRVFASGSKFTNGDTLLARITPCLENGKTAHVDFLGDGETAWGSTEFIVLRPRAPLPPYFGYLQARQTAFRTFAIQAMSGTSGRQRVEIDRLEQFQMTAPDDAVATRFGEIVEPLRQSISANAKRAETLASLRDTLLPRLICGKLRLPSSDTAIDELIEEATA